MIYSSSRKFLFCHVPKTGGTSFRLALSPYRSSFEQSIVSKLLRKIPGSERSPLLYDFSNRPHTTYAKAAQLLGPRHIDLFSFALMREPVDWLYSCYRHFVGHNMRMKHLYLKTQPFTFLDYIEELIPLGDHKPSQSFMFADQDGFARLSWIGNYAHINHCFDFACRALGLNESFGLPHANKNVSFECARDICVPDSIVSLIKKHWVNDCWLFDHIREERKVFRPEAFGSLPLVPLIDLARYDPWGYMVGSD